MASSERFLSFGKSMHLKMLKTALNVGEALSESAEASVWFQPLPGPLPVLFQESLCEVGSDLGRNCLRTPGHRPQSCRSRGPGRWRPRSVPRPEVGGEVPEKARFP